MGNLSYLLGIDSGTNACKAVLFDQNGRPISSEFREHHIHYPKPTWAEQNPDWWWRAAAEAVRNAIKKAKIHPEDISAVGVDSQREAVVLIDSRGENISNSIIWLDRRSIPQAVKMKKILHEEDVISKTGVPIDYIYSAARLMWYKDDARDLFKKTKKILFPKDYIVYKLTGEAATDYSMASRTMLLNIYKRRWDEELCELLGIPISLLPPVKGAWEVVGEVVPDAAEATGLKVGIPVVAGGGDRPVEALGASVVEPGKVNIGTGTATAITTPLSKPRIDAGGKVDCCCHVVPGKWEYELAILTTGASFRWFRNNFAYKEREQARKYGGDPYEKLVKLTSEIPPGSEYLFYYPYPMGAKAPKFNELARAVFFGVTLSHSKAHFIKAIMEGVAFQYAETLELLEKLCVKPIEASIVGGEAKSDIWNQMKADIIGLKVWVPEVPDAAALGSAILSGIGAKVYKTVRDGVECAVRFKKSYNPNYKRNRQYQKIQVKYRNVYESFKKGYKIISEQ